METETVKELKSRFSQLRNNRAQFEGRWTEAQNYVDNNVLSWGSLDTLPSVPKRYSSLPYNYSKTLAAGIVGYSISPSITWFKLSLEQQELLDQYGVKDFLEKCERVIFAEYNASNLYSEAVRFVRDAIILGHGVMLQDEDINTGRLRFTKFPANETYLDINEYGDVDTVFRNYQDTLRNVAEFFGVENLHPSYREIAKDPERWNEKVEILQCVYPRKNYDENSPDAKNMPYACIYLDVKNSYIISESGYDNFPFAIFEWERYAGYAYSSSPAQDAMPDIKALNIIKKTSLQIAQTSAEPPMKLSEDVRKLDLAPKGKTYLPAKDSVLEPIRTGENYPITLQELQNYEQNIKDWFYVDYFLMLQNQNKNMTATEVMELQGEKSATLSSMIVQINEALKKLIQRSFFLLFKNGKLPDLPETLMDMTPTMKVDFVGPLAQAQKKYHTMGGTMQALQIAQPIMQLFPEAGDFIDADALMKAALEGQGMPQTVIREDDDVQKIRMIRMQQQQAQMQQAQQMQMAQSLMQNADKLGQAPQEGSPITQLTQQIEGGMGYGQ